MYADDATLFLKDMIDFREVLSRIKLFTKFSGLHLNKQKSAAMKIGDVTYKDTIKFGIKFDYKLKILGITFSNEFLSDELEENIKGKIEQLERLCSLWQKRHLTFLGKITILKSFGISLFIHVMQSIGINEDNLKKINAIIFRFIWSKDSKKTKRCGDLCVSPQNRKCPQINLKSLTYTSPQSPKYTVYKHTHTHTKSYRLPF